MLLLLWGMGSIKAVFFVNFWNVYNRIREYGEYGNMGIVIFWNMNILSYSTVVL